MDFSYDPNVVVCPECGSEYQLHVTHCIDCGTPTQSGWGSTDLGRQELARRALRLPEDQDSFVVRGGELEWAKSFGSFLEEHGIPWRLEVEKAEHSDRLSYWVHVAERDLDRARELEQEHLLLENPVLAAEFRELELPSADQCPACGSPVSMDSSECPSCGLALDGPILDEAG